MSKIQELLIVTDKDVAEVRKQYQKSESDIQQDVAILKEWLRQQPHLPDDEDDRLLERMFIRNKCRLEQTKKKLDRYYSFKVLYPEMLDMYDVNSSRIQTAIKSQMLIPLPKLTDKQERILFFRAINGDIFSGLDATVYQLMVMELCNMYDYSSADILIGDWSNSSFNDVKSFELNDLHHFSIISMEALSARFSCIRFINAPTYLDTFMKLSKVALKPKLFAKIKCTSNFEEIYDIVPKQLLPMDNGGEQKLLHELHEDWCKEFVVQKEALMKRSKKTSKEKLRIEQLAESELFGAEGSFRKINLD